MLIKNKKNSCENVKQRHFDKKHGKKKPHSRHLMKIMVSVIYVFP